MYSLGPLEWLCFSGPCVYVLGRAWPRLRDTTLAAPWLWCGIALPVVWFPYLYDYNQKTLDGAYYRYIATVLLIAPTLAVLGAKRPQNGAWQFIVLTLVGVLLMPAAQSWFLDDRAPHVHILFRWLILVHILVGVVNYLPTRFAGPAVTFGLAQAAMAHEFFPYADAHEPPYWKWTVCLLTVAACWAGLVGRRAPRVSPGIDRVWRDFRDAYGVVWGLRIAERLNSMATKHGWPVEFTWSGVELKHGATALEPELRRRIQRELRSHLRRFVSHDWIMRRLGHDNAAAGPS